MRFLMDRASLVLEGTHDEIVVPLSLELPDKFVVPAGEERISDREATDLARAEAARRPGETPKAYEARVVRLVTWSQEHIRQLVEQRRGAPVALRAPVTLVLASPPVETIDGQE